MISKMKYLATLLVGATVLGFGACADEWNDHYDSDSGQLVTDAPSLLEHIKADADLQQFGRVLEHVGYDRVLASPQALTVWAPVISSQQADSIIQLYDTEKQADANGRVKRDEENTAITQFVQNHMALYNRSVPDEYSDSIRMLNGKYMVLGGHDLNGVPFVKKNILANNGIMFKLPYMENFFPNVREALTLAPNMTNMANLYNTFDKYELNEQQSVQMGVVDGKIVYADSVLDVSNALYRSLGYIAREDSNYLMLSPTDEVFEREYNEYRPLFNYVDAMANRDSVADLNARFSILRGRIFNINSQKNDYNDSIFNTAYINMNGYYGLNVFFNPKAEGGILNGLTPQTCSNGLLYTDSEGRIDPTLTFKQVRYISATSVQHRSTPLLKYQNENMPISSVIPRSIPDSISTRLEAEFGIELKDDNFIEVAPITYGSSSDNTNTNSSIYFYLPNTFSNVWYNVYVVMVPPSTSGDKVADLPVRFKAYHQARRARPRVSSTSTSPNDDLEFDFTNDATEGSTNLRVPEDETHGSGSYFLTSGTDVDVICLVKGLESKLSCYNAVGSADPIHRFRLTSDVRPTNLGKSQTNVMYINRIFYIPFASKEEAEAYQLDMSNLKEFKE